MRSRSYRSQPDHASPCRRRNRPAIRRPQRHGVGEAVVAHRLLERGDIGVCGHAQRAAVRVDARQPLGRLETEQRLAQVGRRELVRLVGPQQRGYLGARDPRPLEGKERDQLMAPLERKRVRFAVLSSPGVTVTDVRLLA
jgi:hypothetical protein